MPVREQYTATARQFLVKVHGIPGNFAQKTGGDISAASSKVYNGGREHPDVVAAIAEAGDVSVSRPFEIRRDNPILRELRERVGEWRTTVSVQPVNTKGQAIGRPTVYSEALLVGLSEPEYAAASGDGASWGLTFAIGKFR